MEETRRLILAEYPDAAVAMRHMDVSSETSVEEFYSFAVSQFGSIDYAAHVAGVAQTPTPIHQNPDAVFDRVYAVNQRGVSIALESGSVAHADDAGFSMRTRSSSTDVEAGTPTRWRMSGQHRCRHESVG